MKIKPHLYDLFNQVSVSAFNIWFYSRAFILFGVILLLWVHVPSALLKNSRLKAIQQEGVLVEGRVVEIRAEREKLYRIYVKFDYQIAGTAYTSTEVFLKRHMMFMQKMRFLPVWEWIP